MGLSTFLLPVILAQSIALVSANCHGACAIAAKIHPASCSSYLATTITPSAVTETVIQTMTAGDVSKRHFEHSGGHRQNWWQDKDYFGFSKNRPLHLALPAHVNGWCSGPEDYKSACGCHCSNFPTIHAPTPTVTSTIMSLISNTDVASTTSPISSVDRVGPTSSMSESTTCTESREHTYTTPSSVDLVESSSSMSEPVEPMETHPYKLFSSEADPISGSTSLGSSVTSSTLSSAISTPVVTSASEIPSSTLPTIPGSTSPGSSVTSSTLSSAISTPVITSASAIPSSTFPISPGNLANSSSASSSLSTRSSTFPTSPEELTNSTSATQSLETTTFTSSLTSSTQSIESISTNSSSISLAHFVNSASAAPTFPTGSGSDIFFTRPLSSAAASGSPGFPTQVQQTENSTYIASTSSSSSVSPTSMSLTSTPSIAEVSPTQSTLLAASASGNPTFPMQLANSTILMSGSQMPSTGFPTREVKQPDSITSRSSPTLVSSSTSIQSSSTTTTLKASTPISSSVTPKPPTSTIPKSSTSTSLKSSSSTTSKLSSSTTLKPSISSTPKSSSSTISKSSSSTILKSSSSTITKSSTSSTPPTTPKSSSSTVTKSSTSTTPTTSTISKAPTSISSTPSSTRPINSTSSTSPSSISTFTTSTLTAKMLAPTSSTSSICAADNCFASASFAATFTPSASAFCESYISSSPGTVVLTSTSTVTVFVTNTQDVTAGTTTTPTVINTPRTTTTPVQTVSVAVTSTSTITSGSQCTVTQTTTYVTSRNYAIEASSAVSKRAVKRATTSIPAAFTSGCNQNGISSTVSSACACFLTSQTSTTTITTTSTVVASSVTATDSTMTFTAAAVTQTGSTQTVTAPASTTTTTISNKATTTAYPCTSTHTSYIVQGSMSCGIPSPTSLNPSGTISCSTAAAPGYTNARLRVEGIETIFEDCLTSNPRNITTSSGGTESCDGTNYGANDNPGATDLTFLDSASILAGFTYDGTFNANDDDFFITRIGQTSETNTTGWGLLDDQVYTFGGGCQSELFNGHRGLWAWGVFNADVVLTISPDYMVVNHLSTPTVSVMVYGTDPETGSSAARPNATVANAGTNGASVISDSNGMVTMQVPQVPGCYQFKAEQSGQLRSNAFYLSVL